VAKGALFLAIDPARFPGGDAFGSRMDTLVRDVWSSEPAEGFDQVSVPGDIERTLRARRVRDGIPLSPASVAELGRIAGELGVEPLKIDQ
jgi:LDH2 family malate/lactate/ureidoglycolate dehydrogenase